MSPVISKRMNREKEKEEEEEEEKEEKEEKEEWCIKVHFFLNSYQY